MEKNSLIPLERIVSRIFLIKGKKIMLDIDLAELYEVETKNLKRAVKRNIERFPDDFMFELDIVELKNLRCHFGTSKRGGIRYRPYAFTELGVAMLSIVLKSKRAILVSIEIMRAFTEVREFLASNRKLRLKIEELEKRYDKNFKIIFDTLKKMISEEEKPKRMMGFCEKK